MTTALLVLAVFWLAYSNGANDNFKGVATLWGSGAATFRGALAWATIATVAGGLTSVLIASELADKFAGRNLVPAELLATPELALAAGGAAAVTILLATVIGMPTSTTHALVGGLIGAAAVAVGGVNGSAAMSAFFLPLLISPFLAIVGAAAFYAVLRQARLRMGIERQTCLCIGDAAPQPVTIRPDGQALLIAADRPQPLVRIGDRDTCMERYDGNLIGVEAHTAVNAMHYLSGGAVCFSRAVNDTPKIAALMIAAGATFTLPTAALMTFAMAAGGLLQSRRVAATMAQRITDLNPGQGLTANLTTAGLVLGASHLGVPVSTTHVSCGAIFGIGTINRRTHWKTVARIAAAWLTTLPLGLVLGAVFYRLIQIIGN